jgi:hypothetical protein
VGTKEISLSQTAFLQGIHRLPFKILDQDIALTDTYPGESATYKEPYRYHFLQ